MPTIFIQIASYRDSELTETLQSCIENAAFADNLRFGVVNQFGAETEHQLDDYIDDPRFSIVQTPWQEARGVGVARRKTNDMYNGEDFYLQIDSHMRFVKDWDVRIVNEWQKCGDKMAILSSYPPAYRYDDTGKEIFVESKPNRLVVHDFYLDKIPTFFGKELPGNPSNPTLAAFASGGLQFGPGEVCQNVPYEPRICFIGEEIVHSLRLFTQGYNIYAPVDQVVSHLYIRSKNQKDSHHFWNDFNSTESLKEIYKDMNDYSYQVVDAYLAGQQTDMTGNARSLSDYENFAGVDFRQHRVHKDTYSVPSLPMANSGDWKSEAITTIKQS